MYLSKIEFFFHLRLHYPRHEEVTTDVTKGNKASYEIWFHHTTR